MNRMIMLSTGAVALALAAGCPPAGECQTNADCPQGQICGSTGACADPNGPVPGQDAARPPTDAAVRDAVRPDTAGEDLVGVDSGGSTQVTSIATCNGPRALALDEAADSLYVGCSSADTIVLYHPVTGEQQDELISLPSPCKPSALHLPPQPSQLWVACSDSSRLTVLNVNPATGSTNEPGFAYETTGIGAHFASSSDRLVWVDVSGNFYHLRQISGTATTSTAVAANPVLNLGNGVAMSPTGNFYMTNYLNATGNIPWRTKTDSPQQDYVALTINNQLIAFADRPASAVDVLVIASNSAYSRMQASTGSVVGTQVNIGLGSAARALVAQPGGEFVYLCRYLTATNSSVVDQIATDPAIVSPTIDSKTVASCNSFDLAVASDRRVFVACANSNRVEVLQFDP
jgi:hypothetical protein